MKKITKNVSCDRCKKSVPWSGGSGIPKGWHRVQMRYGVLKTIHYELCDTCVGNSKALSETYKNHLSVLAWVLEQPNAFRKSAIMSAISGIKGLLARNRQAGIADAKAVFGPPKK